MQRNSKKRPNIRNVLLLFAGSVLALFMFVKYSKKRIPPHGLTPTGCQKAQSLRFCSHRGSASEWGQEEGTVEAFWTLWTYGITCFDMDFVATRDNHLIATHPARFKEAMSKESPVWDIAEDVPHFHLAEVRDWGIDDRRFPTAEKLLEDFASMVLPAKASPRPPWERGSLRQMPMFFMDLKGSALAQLNLEALRAHIDALTISDHVMLFLAPKDAPTASAQLRLLEESGWKAPVGRAFPDIEMVNGTAVPLKQDMSDDVMASYAIAGPSIKLGDEFYAKAHKVGKPIFSWVVDDPESLRKALEMEVDAVITNLPVRINEILDKWKSTCQTTA